MSNIFEITYLRLQCSKKFFWHVQGSILSHRKAKWKFTLKSDPKDPNPIKEPGKLKTT